MMNKRQHNMSNKLFSFEYKALVIGSGGAIGQAFVQAFQKDPQSVVSG